MKEMTILMIMTKTFDLRCFYNRGAEYSVPFLVYINLISECLIKQYLKFAGFNSIFFLVSTLIFFTLVLQHK